MRARTLIVMLLMLLMVLTFSTAARAEVEKSADASVSFMSNYVWRGLKLSEDWVIQPTVGLTYGGFGANLWSNYDGDAKEATETDLTLNYATSFDKVGLEVGYIYYELEGLQDTQELYVSVGYDFIVSPSLTVYYDYDEGTGAFFVFALDYSRDLTEKVALSLGASASYLADNNVVGLDMNGDEYSDFHNGEVSASLSISPGGNFYIEPMIAYSFALSDDAEDGISAYSFDGDDNTFYGGVTVGLSF